MNIKTLLILLSITSLLFAGHPIHDKMDPRLKGQSFGGTIEDSSAAEDGLGLVTLQHHSGTSEINSELNIHKILDDVRKTTKNKTYSANLQDSIVSGVIGTTEQQNEINNWISSLTSPTLPTTNGNVDFFGDNSGVLLYEFENNLNDTGNVYNATGSLFSYGNHIDNSSLKFDKGEGIVNLPSSLGSYLSADNYSVSLSFYIDDIGLDQLLLITGFSPGNPTSIIGVSSGYKVVFFQVMQNDGQIAGVFADVVFGQWNNVTIVKEGLNLKLYVNNQLGTGGLNTGTSIFGSSATMSSPQLPVNNGLSLGGWIDNLTYYPLFGEIDNFHIFNRSLTPTEVSQLPSN